MYMESGGPTAVDKNLQGLILKQSAQILKVKAQSGEVFDPPARKRPRKILRMMRTMTKKIAVKTT